MDSDQIRAQIDKKIKLGSPPREIEYTVFIKPDDPESDCLMKFVRDNNLSVEVFDTGKVSGTLAMDDYSLLECDVPCICSPEDYRTVYSGCPGSIIFLKPVEEWW